MKLKGFIWLLVLGVNFMGSLSAFAGPILIMGGGAGDMTTDTAQNITGVKEIQDDVCLNYGNDADICFKFDSASGQQKIAASSASDVAVSVENGGAGNANLLVDGNMTMGTYLYQTTAAFVDQDTTPDVSGNMVFRTANTVATTISNFDGTPVDGQLLVVIVNDALTTFDFTSSSLEGRSTDFLATNGQLLVFVYAAVDSKWHYSSQEASLFNLPTLTGAPANPTADAIYKIDNAIWTPIASPGTSAAYYAIYDGTSYIALFDVDGQYLVKAIETPTLKASELNDTSDPHLLTVAELKNTIITNSESVGADEWDFPARTEGWNFIFIIEAAQNVTLDPNGTEQWYLNGTQMDAGEAIVNAAPTAGEMVACISTEAAVYCKSDDTDWAQETP